MKTNVLVTGSQSQLALTLFDLFAQNDDGIFFDFVSKQELDITSREELNSIFTKKKYTYCINCAAYTNVEQSEITPEAAFLVNAEAVKYLAQVCKNQDVVLIHVSTDYVFDGEASKPYKENAPTNPINQYGRSKLLGEKYIINNWNKYFIIRTSWLYSKHGKNFLNTIINKILKNKEIKVTTSQKGTPTSCMELSQFIYFIVKNNLAPYGVYHFSAQGETTWYKFALHIAKHVHSYNVSKIIPIKNVISNAKRPSYSVLDNSKAKQLYKHNNHWQTDVDIIVEDLQSSYK